MSQLSAAGVNLIKSFEGCELTAYADAKGKVAVGYGHTRGDYKIGDTITQAEADQYFEDDILHW